MKEIIIKIPRPHINQRKIIENARRFNHVKCGRRFGKTTLILELTTPVLNNKKIGVFFPTYKDLDRVWQNIKSTYHNVILKKSESLKTLTVINGGLIDFWSMDNPDSSRGFDYDRVILDEFAKAQKNKEAWTEAIRPTLTDRAGDAYFLSTPKGRKNYFYDLSVNHKNDLDWAFFKFTSYDNPYLNPQEIDSAKQQIDKQTFAQEYLADDIDAGEKEFLYSFNENKHLHKPHKKIDPSLPIWLSFDFNVLPQTCIVAQRYDDDYLHILELIRLDNASIYEMCDYIRVKYPHYWIVTGDASGRNRSGMNNLSYWQIIKKELSLSGQQIKLRAKNIDHRSSQVICNSCLEHKKIRINFDLKELIEDCIYASTDEHGKLIKTQDRGLHFFDGFRYLLDANFPEILKIKQ